MKSVTNRIKVFIFDPLWDELITPELINKLKKTNLELIVTKDIAPLSNCAELFDGSKDRLLCLNPDYVNWKLESEDYENIPHLKGIFTASTSCEWIEQDSANRLGIPISNIVKFSTNSVAEWAIMIMLNLARQTPRIIKDGCPLDFDKDFMKYRGVQLVGKTAGIIGLGRIGSAIAERCKGLGMNVVYWSRSSTNDAYEKLPLKELLATADVIFPTTAKNDATLALFNGDMIRTIKKDAMVVDIVKDMFNQHLLLDMVSGGDLYGYGFEGQPKEFAKFNGNVWAVPAYAWATSETMHNSIVMLVDNIIAASKGQYPNKVN